MRRPCVWLHLSQKKFPKCASAQSQVRNWCARDKKPLNPESSENSNKEMSINYCFSLVTWAIPKHEFLFRGSNDGFLSCNWPWYSRQRASSSMGHCQFPFICFIYIDACVNRVTGLHSIIKIPTKDGQPRKLMIQRWLPITVTRGETSIGSIKLAKLGKEHVHAISRGFYDRILFHGDF